MSIIDTIKGLFGDAHSKLPENLNSVEDIKAKAQDIAGQHSDTANNAVDSIQERIPGETGDAVVDSAQDRLNGFADKK